MTKLLTVNNLKVWYENEIETKTVIENLEFSLEKGETIGLIGRSGSGKSTIAWALTGMLPLFNGGCSGEIIFSGKNLVTCNQEAFQQLRWKKIAMVPQAAMNSFNPVQTIGTSLREVIKTHQRHLNKKQIIMKCLEIIHQVKLHATVLDCFPHQLSGGMKQRAAVAMALSCEPELLILDEATTGLDVIIEAEVLRVISELQENLNMAILIISHDSRLINSLCDKLLKIEEGRGVDIQHPVLPFIPRIKASL